MCRMGEKKVDRETGPYTCIINTITILACTCTCTNTRTCTYTYLYKYTSVKMNTVPKL